MRIDLKIIAAALFIALFGLICAKVFSAELGAGSGTGYPDALDTDATQETNNNYVRIDIPNDTNAAVVAIQVELSSKPGGGYADGVRGRLDAVAVSTTAIPQMTTAQLKVLTPSVTGQLFYNVTTESIYVATGTVTPYAFGKIATVATD